MNAMACLQKMLQFILLINIVLIYLGMRKSCEILIFVNLQKALSGKIEIYIYLLFFVVLKIY